jgi:hypothetical protein
MPKPRLRPLSLYPRTGGNPDGPTSQSTKPASGQLAGYLPQAGEGANVMPKPRLRPHSLYPRTGATLKELLANRLSPQAGNSLVISRKRARGQT